jgi:hypothetical protein
MFSLYLNTSEKTMVLMNELEGDELGERMVFNLCSGRGQCWKWSQPIYIKKQQPAV